MPERAYGMPQRPPGMGGPPGAPPGGMPPGGMAGRPARPERPGGKEVFSPEQMMEIRRLIQQELARRK